VRGSELNECLELCSRSPFVDWRRYRFRMIFDLRFAIGPSLRLLIATNTPSRALVLFKMFCWSLRDLFVVDRKALARFMLRELCEDFGRLGYPHPPKIIARSLALSLRKFCGDFLRPKTCVGKIYCVGNSSRPRNDQALRRPNLWANRLGLAFGQTFGVR
jgi:hypothetical protein